MEQVEKRQPSAPMRVRSWSAHRQHDRVGLPGRVSERIDLDLAEVGLILIDVWDEEAIVSPWPGTIVDRLEALKRLMKLVAEFRRLGLPIFHDHTGFPIHQELLRGWSTSDFLIEWYSQGGGTEIMHQLLQKHGVRTIFWAGFSANVCLVAKPCGFRKILETDWDRRHVVVRDCTAGLESESTQATRALRDAAIYEIEYLPLGWSTTSDDAIDALSGRGCD